MGDWPSAGLAAAFAVLTLAAGPLASAQPSGRFASLKVERANGRVGPSQNYRTAWVYQRPGLPLQIVGEQGPWRQVVDPDGARVWIHADNLDSRHTTMITTATALRRTPHANARAIAHLEPGVIGGVTGCTEGWRRVVLRGRVGWVEQDALWGAGPCP